MSIVSSLLAAKIIGSSYKYFSSKIKYVYKGPSSSFVYKTNYIKDSYKEYYKKSRSKEGLIKIRKNYYDPVNFISYMPYIGIPFNITRTVYNFLNKKSAISFAISSYRKEKQMYNSIQKELKNSLSKHGLTDKGSNTIIKNITNHMNDNLENIVDYNYDIRNMGIGVIGKKNKRILRELRNSKNIHTNEIANKLKQSHANYMLSQDLLMHGLGKMANQTVAPLLISNYLTNKMKGSLNSYDREDYN